jgi:putative transposase
VTRRLTWVGSNAGVRPRPSERQVRGATAGRAFFELLKLGIVVSNRSIRRYRWQVPTRPPSQSWRTFLHNRANHLWAADLLTVPTLTFKALYVLVFIAHGRRELIHLNVTANPTAAWIWRQLMAATPWGQKPRHLLRDCACGDQRQ